MGTTGETHKHMIAGKFQSKRLKTEAEKGSLDRTSRKAVWLRPGSHGMKKQRIRWEF